MWLLIGIIGVLIEAPWWFWLAYIIMFIVDN